MTATSVLEFTCPECRQKFAKAQALGAHRRVQHPGAAAAASNGGGKTHEPKTAKATVLVELVDEEPPPPPAPKKKPADLIVETVLAAELEPGAWKRCALFPSSNAATRMAKRLTVEQPAYEWQSAPDGRLFVRVAA